jgi:hypothetical protein
MAGFLRQSYSASALAPELRPVPSVHRTSSKKGRTVKLVSKLPENRPSEGSFFFLGVAIGVSVPLMLLAFSA